MENKTVLLVGLMVLASTGAFALLFILLKPSGVREAEQTKASSFDFPAPAPAAVSAPLPPAVGRGDRTQASSLGFIQKDAALAGPSARTPAPFEAPAPQVKAPPPQPSQRPASLSEAGVRELMQWIVDTVHQKQPAWYREFLSRGDLKGIADRYDQSNDFKTFLKELADSRTFNRMLQLRKGKKPLRDLVAYLLEDAAQGAKAGQLLLQYAPDPSAQTMIRRYGKGTGLPDQVLAQAQVDPNEPDDKPVPKLQLKSLPGTGSNRGGFGARGGFGNSGSGSGQPQLKPLNSNGFGGFGSSFGGGNNQNARSGAFYSTSQQGSASGQSQSAPRNQIQFPTVNTQSSESQNQPQRQFRSAQ